VKSLPVGGVQRGLAVQEVGHHHVRAQRVGQHRGGWAKQDACFRYKLINSERQNHEQLKSALAKLSCLNFKCQKQFSGSEIID